MAVEPDIALRSGDFWTMMQASEASKMNETRGPLRKQLMADTVAAVTAATAVTPFITAIDRSVVEKVSTKRPLVKTLWKNILCPLTHPRRFFATKPVFVIWTLYAATYLTANTTETLSDIYLDIGKAITSTIVSTAVFAVNTPLGVWKDVRFAQYFGVSTPVEKKRTTATAASLPLTPQRVPVSVSATFILRDMITVFGSFAIAPQVSAVIPDSIASNPLGKASAAQLIVPAMTQIFATPAHLLALDIYNRPKAPNLRDRMIKTRENLVSTTAMRAFRLIPAFGFGIILNDRLRSHLRDEGNQS